MREVKLLVPPAPARVQSGARSLTDPDGSPVISTPPPTPSPRDLPNELPPLPPFGTGQKCSSLSPRACSSHFDALARLGPPLQVPISCTDRPCISLRRPRFWGCTGHRLRRRVPACPPRAPPFQPPRPGRAVALPPRDRSCTGGRRVPRTNLCVNSVQSRAFGSTSPGVVF